MERSQPDTAPRLALLGWFTGALFFQYAWILRVAPSVMIDELMRDFAIGAGAIGNLSAAYYYGYAGFQIPVGLLIDRFGPRRLMTIAGLVCAASCVLFALSPVMSAAAAARFAFGGAAAFSLVGAMAVAGQWFAANRFALLSGLAMMTGLSGGIIGQAPLRLGVEAYGWRTASAALAAGGLLVALLAWTTVRDRRRAGAARASVLADLKAVAGNPQTWVIAIAGLGTAGPLLGFAGLWGVPFLVAIHGLDPARAAAITSATFMGFALGAPVFGWASDHFARRRLPLVVGLALAVSTLAVLIYVPGLSPTLIAALCFLTGAGCAAQVIGFATVRELNPPGMSGAAIGFVNCAVTGGGALYQPLLGAALDFAWDGRLAAGARVYSVAAYQAAFSALVIGTGIGLVCALLIRETYCRPVSS